MYHRTILGRTREGKSYYSEWLLRQEKPAIFFDYKHDLTLDGISEDVLLLLDQKQRLQLLMNLKKSNKIMVVKTDSLTDIQQTRVLVRDFIHDILLLNNHYKNPKPFYIYVDEADQFAPKSGNENDKVALSEMKRLFSKGGGKQVWGRAITQRIAGIHNDILTNSELILFRPNKHDMKTVRTYFDVPDSFDPPRRSYIFFDSVSEKIHRKVSL